MKTIFAIFIFTLTFVPFALAAQRGLPDRDNSPDADSSRLEATDFKFITIQSLDNGLSIISWNNGRKKYWALSNMDFHKLPSGKIWSDADNGYTVFYTQIDNTMSPPKNKKGKQVIKELLESYDAKYFVLKKVKRKHNDDIKFLDWLHEYYDENRYRMEEDFAYSKSHLPEPQPAPIENYNPEFSQTDANSLGLTSLLPEGGIAAMMNMGNGPCIPNEGLLIENGSVAGEFILRWFGEDGRTYFIKDSIDIVNGFNWQHEAGVGSGSEMTFTVSGYEVTDAFFRLAYTDDPYTNDFDGDGLSNAVELGVKFNPLDASSKDGDALGDDWENFYFGGLQRDGTLDFDSDGILDKFEYQAHTDPIVDQTAQSSEQSEYSYDSLGRVSNVTGPVNLTYTFDNEGNLQSAQ